MVYTAIFGGYDQLKEPAVVTPGIRYVCFTDRDLESDTWEIVRVSTSESDPRRASRPFKIRPHAYFKASYSLWVDASFTVGVDVRELIRRHLGSRNLAGFAHRERDCVFDEASVCAEWLLDDPRIIASQVLRYAGEGLPRHAGLFECGVLLRKHRPDVAALNELWWDEYGRGCCRDQISFGYSVWQTAFPVALMPGTVYSHPGLAYSPHLAGPGEDRLAALLADERDPQSAEASIRFAQSASYRLSGEDDKADDAYAEAIRMNPNHVRPAARAS